MGWEERPNRYREDMRVPARDSRVGFTQWTRQYRVMGEWWSMVRGIGEGRRGHQGEELRGRMAGRGCTGLALSSLRREMMFDGRRFWLRCLVFLACFDRSR